jgi:hypothetical protein
MRIRSRTFTETDLAATRPGRDGDAVSNSFSCSPRDVEGLNECAVDLYWIPLSAGHRIVRLKVHAYEAICALITRRPRRELYHSALHVLSSNQGAVIEMSHTRDERGMERGVVAEGPIGFRRAGRYRIFRYEIRCWRDGVVTDARFAVSSPTRLASDETTARRLAELSCYAPMFIWGRDELRVHDRWTSNSVISWMLESSGVDAARIEPPAGGHAPGWKAGIVAAHRIPPVTPGTIRSTSRRRAGRLQIRVTRRVRELRPSSMELN